MSKDNFFKNLARVASNMFTQFSTEEPLISEEGKILLNNYKSRQEVYNKIIKEPKTGEVQIKIDNKEVTFFVEA